MLRLTCALYLERVWHQPAKECVSVLSLSDPNYGALAEAVVTPNGVEGGHEPILNEAPRSLLSRKSSRRSHHSHVSQQARGIRQVDSRQSLKVSEVDVHLLGLRQSNGADDHACLQDTKDKDDKSDIQQGNHDNNKLNHQDLKETADNTERQGIKEEVGSPSTQDTVDHNVNDNNYNSSNNSNSNLAIQIIQETSDMPYIVSEIISEAAVKDLSDVTKAPPVLPVTIPQDAPIAPEWVESPTSSESWSDKRDSKISMLKEDESIQLPAIDEAAEENEESNTKCKEPTLVVVADNHPPAVRQLPTSQPVPSSVSTSLPAAPVSITPTPSRSKLLARHKNFAGKIKRALSVSKRNSM